MQISFSQPLDTAWLRMKTFLFQPFDLGRWFVLGFTAWLAELAGGYPGGASRQMRFEQDWDPDLAGNILSGAAGRLEDFFEHPWAFLLGGMILVAGLLFYLLLLWISSRGRFMFLDNLVHRRTEVITPWTAFASQGNSLFLWKVGYSVVVFLVMGSLFAGALLVFFPVALAVDPPLAATVPLAIIAGTVGFLAVVSLVFIDFFLAQFVVPLMYRHGISVTEAWRRFLPMFRKNPGSFVLYGLLYFGIMLVGWILYVTGGLLTCCVGLFLLILPYLGTVLMLPLLTFVRYLSLDFLGQFGDDFRLLDPLVPTPNHPYPGSGQIQGDGTVVGSENFGEDPGTDQSGPQGP